MFRASSFKLTMYEQCPQKYKFHYIDGLAEQYKVPKPYLTMGAHVHNALRDLYEKVEPTDRTFEKAAQLLRQRWIENRKGFDSIDQEKEWGVKALNMLRLFTHRMDMTKTPVLLEDYYDTDIDADIRVLGKVDRADELEDGSLHVIDYKTGKYKEEEVSNLQLQIYSLIVSANRTQQVTKASYLFLPTMQWHTIDIDPEAIEEAAEEMREQVRTILATKEFPVQLNAYCGSCDFLAICPAQDDVRKQLAEKELLRAAEIAEKSA
jgi:putative RecB family exonuclease